MRCNLWLLLDEGQYLTCFDDAVAATALVAATDFLESTMRS